MSYGGDFVLTLFTNAPELARFADAADVDRVGIDLERIGKSERQGGLPVWISDHEEGDLAAVRAAVAPSRLFARCNPIHPGSAAEIDRLVSAGVRTLMLPYFRTVAEAETFIRLVDKRARPVLLLETAQAAAQVDELCRLSGGHEIHVGLNDLRLSLGWPTHFHVLVSDLLAHLCERVLDAAIPLAVGGVGRAGDESLPIPADLVLAQYPRLGACGALVSRAFLRMAEPGQLPAEVARLRTRLDELAGMSPAWLALQRTGLRRLVGQ